MTCAKRFSYAASDTAGQLVFCVISFYLLKFYTDVYGIPTAIAGTILLAARLADAVDAPVWGILFDKTRSRWGKSRPWFLWLCGPFSFFGLLTFLTPNLGLNAKIAYAAGTYIACSVLYTGINTPVTSILSALTSDARERVTLTCYRMFGSKLGALLVNLTVLPAVHWAGRGDDRKGFMLVMPFYAAGSALLYLLAFRNLEEVVHEETRPISIRDSVGAIRGNWPWVIIFASSLFFWIGFIARICAAPYFFQYTLGRADLIPLANGLDFISLGSVFCLPFLCRVMSKRNLWLLGLAGMVLGQIVLYGGLKLNNSLPVIMAGWSVGFLASGIAMAMPFSLLSDSVDYGEWKTGIRAAGFLTAIGAAFCLKAGSGLGGALPAWILDAHGYVPNAVQTPAALQGIELGFVWAPAACLILGIVPVLFYGRFERLEPAIQEDLRARRLSTEMAR